MGKITHLFMKIKGKMYEFLPYEGVDLYQQIEYLKNQIKELQNQIKNLNQGNNDEDNTPTLSIEPEMVFTFPESAGDFVSNNVASHDTFTSTEDGNPVVLTYDNFTVNAGHTVTVSNRCKGLYLYIKGDLTVSGTLSMTARGCKGAGKYVITDYKAKKKFVMFLPSTSDINEILSVYDKNQVIYPVGGVGSTTASNPGVNGACGAGGFSLIPNSTSNYLRAQGSSGTSFSGGAGAGGGINSYIGCTGTGCSTASSSIGYAGTNNGGAGGNTKTNGQLNITTNPANSTYYYGGGGAGNPGGSPGYTNFPNAGKGTDGTGGLLILIVDGNINITGSIQSNGSKGGDGYRWYNSSGASGGGGSGGGAIHIFSKKENNINTDKLSVTGGAGGTGNAGKWTTSRIYTGGTGGKGLINIVSMN